MIKENQIKEYLDLLSRGNEELTSRKRAYPVIPKFDFKGFSIGMVFLILFSSVVHFLDSSSMLQLLFQALAIIGGLVTMMVMCAVSFKEVAPVEVSYTQEEFLNTLSEEHKSLAEKLIAANEKRERVQLEYKTSEEDFLIKYFGQCNKEMLYDTKLMVEKNRQVLEKLADPESSEHQKIKPQAKLAYRG